METKVFTNVNNNTEVVFDIKTTETLKNLREYNCHTMVRTTISILLSYDEFTKEFKRIERIENEKGYLPYNEATRRYALTNDMLGQIERDYGRKVKSYIASEFL